MAINTTKATMQMRRGNEADFEPDKMLPGEWAVSLDNKYVRMCFAPGVCIRMATYEGFEEDMQEISEILKECQDIKDAVLEFGKLSESWAVGGTGTRDGEDENNSQWYANLARLAKEAAEKAAELAQGATGTNIATVEKAGIVKPDGITITIETDGTIKAQGGSAVDIATTEKAGIVKPDGETINIGEDGTISIDQEKIEKYKTGTIATFPIPGSSKILYIDVDTNTIYRYDTETAKYIPVGSGGAGNLVFLPFAEFPLIGDAESLYIDTSATTELKLYRWNGSEYVENISGEGVLSSADIPLTLSSTSWTGTTAPYTQTVTVPQMREGMTPILYLSNSADANILYAYGLIVDYTASYGKMTFYAADLPSVDIDIVLKGVPAQQLEYVDNTVIVLVSASGFKLNEEHGRYEQTIDVDGMKPGLGGSWDIVRSGPVLTVQESKIVSNITDINRLDGAVKIVCLKPPEQDYMLYFQGTQTPVNDDTPILANMQGWFDKVNQLEEDLTNTKTLVTVLWENPNPASGFAAQTITLSSDEYDMYEIFYTVRSNGNSFLSARSIKGHGTELNTGYVDNSTLQQRAVTYISDTELRFENAYSGTTVINGYIRPIKIIGYKL